MSVGGGEGRTDLPGDGGERLLPEPVLEDAAVSPGRVVEAVDVGHAGLVCHATAPVEEYELAGPDELLDEGLRGRVLLQVPRVEEPLLNCSVEKKERGEKGKG